jgi:GTP pyrophosphokinase
MKTLHTSYFTPDELTEFRDTYRKLVPQARPFFSTADWRTLRRLVVDGVDRGAYPRDAHGINLLLMNLKTSLVIVDEIGLKQASLLMIMLYPLVEHGVMSVADIEQHYGTEISRLIDGMSKVKSLYAHDAMADENFRKLLLSLAEDIRVVIGLIADRYVLMKTLNHHPDHEYRHHVTEECQYLYTPMAHRLGLYAIKSELEDMAVKYEHRDVFDQIAHQLNETKREREEYIARFIEPLRRRLEDTGMQFSIKGRTKSISSIWHKLKAQNTTLDKIYDLFAIRIIIDAPLEKEKALCWQAYSIVTDLYTPNPKRLKDWLSIPKSNGYESLHITVYGPGQRWVEVQIRSKRMDEIAERGLAAHWKYKGIKSEGAADQVMASIRQTLENNTSPDELMKDFTMGLYQEEIFVFTPGGDVYRLPKGATVLDFAFQIHTKLGMSCVGARVGGRNVKINYPLHSGDTIEVLTSPQQTPKADWLNIVCTTKARIRIKQGIKEIEMRESEMGKELLQRRCKNRKIELDEGLVARLIAKMGFKTQTQFFHALAAGELDINDVLDNYEELMRPAAPVTETPLSADTFNIQLAPGSEQRTAAERRDDVLVIDKNLKGLDYKLARCCNPIYGDRVVGFVSIAGGIKIHRYDCANIHNLQERYPYRIIPARWAGKSGSQYSITLRIVGNDDIGIVSNISSLINKEKDTLLRAINIDSNDGLFQGHLTVSVNDLSSLTALIKKIRTIKGVRQVERVN